VLRLEDRGELVMHGNKVEPYNRRKSQSILDNYSQKQFEGTGFLQRVENQS